MKIRQLSLILVACSICFSSDLSARLRYWADFPTLFDQSTMVFAGKITAIQELPHRDNAGVDFMVDYLPLRIYKGPSTPAIIKIQFRDQEFMEGAPGTVGEVCLEFASPSPSLGDGLYAIPDSSYGFDITPRTNATADLTGIEGLETDLLTLALGEGTPNISAPAAMEMMTHLPALSSTPINALVQHGPMKDNSSELVRVGLLARSDPHKFMPLMVEVISSHRLVDSQGNEIAAFGNGGLELINGVLTQRTGPEDLDTLESLCDSWSISVRTAAIEGIRRLQDPRSAEFLVNYAQSHRDMVGGEAIMALVEMTGRLELAPDAVLWKGDPATYQTLWKAWLKTDLAKFKDHPAAYRQTSETWAHSHTADTPKPER